MCMHSRYAVRAAGFQSNDKSLARRNSSDHSNDSVETIIAFGIARRNMKCLTWSVHQARVMISSSYIRPCAPRTPAPHPDRAILNKKQFRKSPYTMDRPRKVTEKVTVVVLARGLYRKDRQEPRIRVSSIKKDMSDAPWRGLQTYHTRRIREKGRPARGR